MGSEIKRKQENNMEDITNHPIKPSMIDTTKFFWSAFGKQETEVSANWIVRFCQQKNEWVEFTYKDINNFYQTKRNDKHNSFTFNTLISGGFIKEEGDIYKITHKFITNCFKSSPKY